MAASSLTRTLDFIAGRPADRPPFHPIIMRWAARYAGVKYSAFCQDHEAKCFAMTRCARDFDIDWVTVMSDPYAEAQAFGLHVEYPLDDLPLDRGGHLADLAAVEALRPFVVQDHPMLMNRVKTIQAFKETLGDERFIVGWIEGPIAEYGDIRRLMTASLDFYDAPDVVHHALEVITESGKRFAAAQIEAGADCIGIGDAFCSQIGPALYRQFAFAREKELIDHIHALGARAKLHICGDTRALLPDMIRTGADIVDVDHLVPSMSPYVPLLAPHQVLSGNSDPVGIIQNGDAARIKESVRSCHENTGGRCITSAGCEIPPGTTITHMRHYRDAALALHR